MIRLSDTKLVFLDTETTGLFPAYGDRIVELGMIICRGRRKLAYYEQLFDPEIEIPDDAYAVHGIADEDVEGAPLFSGQAAAVGKLLQDAWVVGHRVGFDAGFLGLELAIAGITAKPAGLLDTCELARAVWDMPNYRLDTVAGVLAVKAEREHRALDDARRCRGIFHRVVAELGGWAQVSVRDLEKLHGRPADWPCDPARELPKRLYDALANGGEVRIAYTDGDDQRTRRRIRPLACFAIGPSTYVRAYCNLRGEERTFRLDRIRVV